MPPELCLSPACYLPSWKSHLFIQQRYGIIIEQVEQDLQALAATATSEGENVWGMRQLAYERKVTGTMKGPIHRQGSAFVILGTVPHSLGFLE